MRYLVVMTVLALVPSVEAQSRYATVVNEPRLHVISVDTATEEKTAAGWEVWIKWDYSGAENDGTRDFAYEILRTAVDCSAPKLAILESASYAATGKVVSSASRRPAGDVQWWTPVPETYGEAVHKWVCAYAPWFNGTALPMVGEEYETPRLHAARSGVCAEATSANVKALCTAWRRGPVIAPGERSATPAAVLRWFALRQSLDSALVAAP